MTWPTGHHAAIRRRYLTLALSVMVGLGTTWRLAGVGWACSCAGSWDPKDADVIFRGKAVEVHEPLPLQHIPHDMHGLAGTAWRVWFDASRRFDGDVRTVFRVEEAWRGAPAEYVTLNTGSGLCCNCSLGKRFTVGREYIVYAVRWNGELEMSWCAGRARDVSSGSLSELASLGMGKGELPASSGGYVPLFWRHLMLPATIVLPILFTTVLLLLRAKRRQRTASCD